MALTEDQANRISEIVKSILDKRIENFPDLGATVRNAPFHDAILECFVEKLRPLNVEIPYLIAIASWMHGLNTSLGSGFENISYVLSGGYKRKFTGNFVLKVKSTQAAQIEQIIRDLKSDKVTPNLEKEEKLIYTYPEKDNEVDSLPFTVDTFIERQDEVIGVEMKSVRPNSGEGRGEKQKILYGKAALKLLYPNKKVSFFVGFPFDPTSEEPLAYNKEKFFNYLIEFKKFFAPEEVLIASELWDFLSGSVGTMEEVLTVIKDTVKFFKKESG